MRKGKMSCKDSVKAEKVVNAFKEFDFLYSAFRQDNKLADNIDNVFEITSAMSDKLGRICRYIKHQERNDPKPDWPDGMTIEMSGLLLYMMMLLSYYKIDIGKGMELELNKAVQQHRKE